VDATPWPKDRHQRVSINAFGIGGANAHVVIDSAESFGITNHGRQPATRSSTEQPHARQQLVVFSANHASSLREGAKSLGEYLAQHPESLRDLAYTMGVRRERLPYRSFAVSDGATALEFAAPSRVPSTALAMTFVFTGQGAQWAQMGARLIHDFPSVRQDFTHLDSVLSNLPHAPSWSLVDELSKSKTDSRLGQAEFSQPACTAVQMAVVNLLRSWNISPSAVIGHSSGELAAAYASGAITSAEAITAAYYRGLVTKQQARSNGAMAAVGFGRKDVKPFLDGVDGVVIACENSPESTTLSGDADQIDLVVGKIKANHPDVLARRLQVDMAYHSREQSAASLRY
jgi:acyl transferase domain-containing protein